MPSWLGEFDWLVYDEEKKLMHCKVCRSLPERAEKKDKLFVGTDKFRIEPIRNVWTRSFGFGLKICEISSPKD